MGVGAFVESGETRVDTVAENVHCSVSDSASNIVNGWNMFDGHECNDHLLALTVLAYLHTAGIQEDNDTRTGGGGAFLQAKWFLENQEAVQMYDVEHSVKAATAMDNPNGSKLYKDHKLSQAEWNVVKESVYVLQHPRGAVMLLQASKKPTVSIVLPVIGNLLHNLHEDTVLKWHSQPVVIQSEVVRDGRKNLYNAVKKRFMNDLM
ncbi:hypothetical protein CYMTET_39313, partial [Cymbomonas tetramitiformis]